MANQSEVAKRLKALRAERTSLSIQGVASALGLEARSSYAYYEDGFRKPHLPLWLVKKLIPIFKQNPKLGQPIVTEAELLALAGIGKIQSTLFTKNKDASLTSGSEDQDVETTEGKEMLNDEELMFAVRVLSEKDAKAREWAYREAIRLAAKSKVRNENPQAGGK